VAKIATFFRDNTNVEVTYEYSNECWNGMFAQTGYCGQRGAEIWGASDGAAALKWYGYRAAQCMAIIRGVYGDAARWRGVLATQTVNYGVTTAGIVGVNRFLQDPAANGLTMNDLLKSVMVTGYFGQTQTCKAVTQVTRSNPAVVTAPSHGFVNGQKIKWFVTAGGMTQLDDTYAIVATATTDTFELAGIDTSQFPDWIVDFGNFVTDAALFTMIDESIARNASDAATYPERWTWFAEQLRDSMITGTCAAGYNTRYSVASLKEVIWPAQFAIAAANGMDLRQYEGGCGFEGDIRLQANGGSFSPVFTEFLYATSHTEQMAEVYTASYTAFFEIGGNYPSKFVDLGGDSPYGTWGGMRYVPGDEINPVWLAVRAANEASGDTIFKDGFDCGAAP
jgi:hypothetical protein